MIELVDGFWVDPWEVKVVRKTGEEKCVLYVTGEGAMDGHVLDYSTEDVVQAIMDARNEEGEENSPEED